MRCAAATVPATVTAATAATALDPCQAVERGLVTAPGLTTCLRQGPKPLAAADRHDDRQEATATRQGRGSAQMLEGHTKVTKKH